MKKILVVGSVGIDDIETPAGKVEGVPGGSAIYFSLAASAFADINFVGIAGEDFPKEIIALMRSREINLDGFEIVEGKTFRWSGKYHDNMDSRDSLLTELNVFEKFTPKLPGNYKNSEIVFLANIHPQLQLQVLNEIQNPELVISDTMNFWIEGDRSEVWEVAKRSDIFILNDSEISLLTRESNFLKAADKFLEDCPKLQALVVKLGKYGAYVTDGKEEFFIPAYPLRKVVDPTGAGDSFAGGFTGYLALKGNYSFDEIKKAVIYGSITASFSVSNFSIEGLKNFSDDDIQDAYKMMMKVIKM
ncbi:MAG: PfkB family carbohydrate kinase [Candidatus Delongbacteria bacterium]|jgi:sugar/nucleoside kinase (ribokinase family)|nr:PfkB family carbohydrate kinase [Candidatus Delongbacteria bacterium]